jgi:hypothetical protein
MNEAVDKIRNFEFRRKFIDGKFYVDSLDKSIICLPEVRIAASSMYLSQGHMHLAEETLEFRKKPLDENFQLWEERSAATALLLANIQICRYCNYDEALNVLSAVEKFYIHGGNSFPARTLVKHILKPSLEFPEKMPQVKKDSFRHISQLWSMQDPTQFDDRGMGISDLRVRSIEYSISVVPGLMFEGSHRGMDRPLHRISGKLRLATWVSEEGNDSKPRTTACKVPSFSWSKAT